MSGKVQMDGAMLIELLRHSMKIGTQDAAIRLAVEWIGSAEAEIGWLREVCVSASVDLHTLLDEADALQHGAARGDVDNVRLTLWLAGMVREAAGAAGGE